jgi:preprotein translocase YajC subunit
VNWLPFVAIAVLLGGAMLFTSRQRQRAAAQQAGLRERLRVGSNVMTTSGLYGVIRSIDEQNDAVELEIAVDTPSFWRQWVAVYATC